MNVSRHQGGWIILATFGIAFMLDLMPMPEWADRFRPQWVALILIYWCVTMPERVGVGIGWSSGLLLDVARGSLLGQHALATVLVALISNKTCRRLRVLPLWQQSITVWLLLTLHEVVVFWVYGIIGYPPNDWWYLTPPLTGMVLWPWLTVILRDVRRRYVVI